MLAVALLAHAAVPRYEIVLTPRNGTAIPLRFDRWTGQVTLADPGVPAMAFGPR